ncbi:hypothetical protein DKX38_014689 [Salix brachista]|uniref:Phytosulfokine n=1 Tax=Salix brachista TaxID=2182728 RepID=A0A5N5LFY7_9ROSI|nr:hypothetical protein DKX38_014689 [Salix brachista]
MMGNSRVHVLRLTRGDCQVSTTVSFTFGVFRAMAGPPWQTVTKAFLFFDPSSGQEEVNLDEITSEGTEDGGLMNLMGLEICDGGDEECSRRRIIAEAHMDYIYTQHHKP